jgi:WD40 repeat protein
MHRFLILTVCLSMAAIARAQEQNPPGRMFEGHKGSVTSVAFTRDGKTLVSGSRDDLIKVWDVATGQLKKTLDNHKQSGGEKGDIYALAFSHDGKLMASGSMDTTIILWDASTFEPIRTLKGHTGPLREVNFSIDDKTLASAAEDGTFRLWDVASGENKVTRTDHHDNGGQVKGVVYFPDGKTIATAGTEGAIRTWDAQTGEPKLVMQVDKKGFEFVDVSPDGTQLMSGTGNVGQVIFWDARTGKPLKVMPNAHGNDHGAEVDSGHYSADGKWAITGSKDRSDKCWDPKTFELLHEIKENPGRSESMCFSPDGKTLAVGFGGTDTHVELFDLSGWEK